MLCNCLDCRDDNHHYPDIMYNTLAEVCMYTFFFAKKKKKKIKNFNYVSKFTTKTFTKQPKTVSKFAIFTESTSSGFFLD